MIFMLTMLAACGGGGGSSSAVPGEIPSVNVAPQIYTYEIRIEGVAGASVASNLIFNFADNDQEAHILTVTLDNTQLVGGIFFGRNIFWDVQSTSNNPVTIRVIRDGVEVINETLTSNGEIKTLRNNF